MTHTFQRFLLLVILTSPVWAIQADDSQYATQRAEMIQAIEKETRQTRHYLDKSEFDPRVMQAMASVPRHAFVP